MGWTMDKKKPESGLGKHPHPITYNLMNDGGQGRDSASKTARYNSSSPTTNHLERQQTGLERLPARGVIHGNVVGTADDIRDCLLRPLEVRADRPRQPLPEKAVHRQSGAIRALRPVGSSASAVGSSAYAVGVARSGERSQSGCHERAYPRLCVLEVLVAVG